MRLILTLALAASTFTTSLAHAAVQDISARLSSMTCRIPSDDQNGIAKLVINDIHGIRTLVLSLQYTADAKWKMVTYPLQLITFNDADGTITMQVQYKSGYTGAAVINSDMKTGLFSMQTPGRAVSIPFSDCQLTVNQ